MSRIEDQPAMTELASDAGMSAGSTVLISARSSMQNGSQRRRDEK